MGRSKTTRALAYSVASSSARSHTPTSSAARATETSSSTRRHRAAWSPAGPSGSAGSSSRTRRASLRVGSRLGTSLGPGRGSRKERTPSSARATTMAQSAVCPSTTTGLVPGTTQPAPLRRARARTVPSGWPWPCSWRATVPRRSPGARSASRSSAPRARAARVASTAEEKNGPGQRHPAHLLEDDARLEQPGARRRGPACRSIPAPPAGPTARVSNPPGSSASSRSRVGSSSSMARRATSWRATCSASNVKSTAAPPWRRRCDQPTV